MSGRGHDGDLAVGSEHRATHLIDPLEVTLADRLFDVEESQPAAPGTVGEEPGVVDQQPKATIHEMAQPPRPKHAESEDPVDDQQCRRAGQPAANHVSARVIAVSTALPRQSMATRSTGDTSASARRLIAVAIDEVTDNKRHRYLTVVCDHVTGRVVWAPRARSKDTVGKFIDVLGDRAVNVEFVTADGATWITDVVAERDPGRDRVPGHVPRDRPGDPMRSRRSAAKNGTSSVGPGEPKRPRSSRGCGSCCGATGRTSIWDSAK